MEITDIKFRHLQEVGRLKALVSVTFDNVFAVHDIKIIDAPASDRAHEWPWSLL